MSISTKRIPSRQQKKVQEAFDGMRVTRFIDAHRRRYNETLNAEYMGESLMLMNPMHMFHVSIDVLGVDFHWSFALTPNTNEDYETVIVYSLEKVFKEMPYKIMKMAESPKEQGSADVHRYDGHTETSQA